MAFLDKLTNKTLPPTDAGLTCAALTLLLSGDWTDVDRQLLSLFRDQFPPLSFLDDPIFDAALDAAVQRVQAQNYGADVPGFVRTVVVPAITASPERVGLYSYVYALAMADLNINQPEGALLSELRSAFALDQLTYGGAETAVNNEFSTLHRGLAAIAVGLIVVTADGVIHDEELAEIRKARPLLDPIGKLDDTQFEMVYNLGMLIHDRYLLDVDNRRDFLHNIVTQELTEPPVRLQAFHYAASITTSDGDVAQAEVDTLKEMLKALQIPDDTAEGIFNQYMARVKTIDGKPVGQS